MRKYTAVHDSFYMIMYNSNPDVSNVNNKQKNRDEAEYKIRVFKERENPWVTCDQSISGNCAHRREKKMGELKKKIYFE